MQHVFKKPNELSFDKVGIQGRIFPTDQLIDKAEFVYIQTESGHETTIIEHACDFTYYVIDGEGHFVIDSQKENCTVGDLIVVPAGSKFTYKGKLRMLLIVTPPWFESQEETLTT